MKTLAFVVLFAATGSAQTVTSSPVRFAWNASPDVVAGYRLSVDGGPRSEWPGVSTTPFMLAPGPHLVAVRAYTATAESSDIELAFTVQAPGPDTACTPPLGNRAIAIFVTTIQRIGTGGGPFTVARLDFQLASPNSPITHVAVRTSGVDLASVDGTSLAALAGLWFPVPAMKGQYVLSVLATNAYGCTNEILSSKSVTVQ